MADQFDAERVYAAQSPAELAAEYDRVAESYDSVLEQHEWRMPQIVAGLVAWNAAANFGHCDRSR